MATNLQLRSMLTLESQQGPFISIFVPLDHVRDGDFAKQLSERVRERFVQKYPDKAWQPYQEHFAQIKVPHILGRKKTLGLAIYIGPTLLKVFKLNHQVAETIVFGDTTKIIELLIDTQFKHIERSHTLFDAALKNIRVHYHESSHMEMTSDNLDEIVKLAPAGRIDTLLINDAASLEAKNHILNDLAITVIGFGGRVFVLSDVDMPNHKGVAVIRRD